MFSFLFAEIDVPGSHVLRDVAWNAKIGWLCAVGDNGLVQMLRLDTVNEDDVRGVPGDCTVLPGQRLEGHEATVWAVRWNEGQHQLSTSDENGLTIVWHECDGVWSAALRREHPGTVSKDFEWNPDGALVATSFEDGQASVERVNGELVWQKNLGLELRWVEWSPNGELILFSDAAGAVHVFTKDGALLNKVSLHPGENGGEPATVVDMRWHFSLTGADGTEQFAAPSLALAFSTGRLQLMRHEADERPLLVPTGLKIQRMCWNHDGSVLAVAGSLPSTESESGWDDSLSLVKFLSPLGQLLNELRIPAAPVSALDFDKGGLRLAVSVNKHIYFANVRPNYRWAVYENTLVFAYAQPGKLEDALAFWSVDRKAMIAVHQVSNPLHIAAHGHRCCVAVREGGVAVATLELRDTDGDVRTVKPIMIYPLHMAMTATHVIVSDNRLLYAWRMPTEQVAEQEYIWDADAFNDVHLGGFETFRRPKRRSESAIVSLAASESTVFVGRDTGVVHRVVLNGLEEPAKYVLGCFPLQLSVNCDLSLLGIVDDDNTFRVLDLNQGENFPDSEVKSGAFLAHRRERVWSTLWAVDNATEYVLMEGPNMTVFNAATKLRQRYTRGYPAVLKRGRVTGFDMDEVLLDPTTDLQEKGVVIVTLTPVMAVTKIQAMARGASVRARVRRIRDSTAREAAAVRIQTRARGARDRDRVKRIRREKAETVACLRLQSVTRGHQARDKVRAEVLLRTKTAAATKIEAASRGWHARRRANLLRRHAALDAAEQCRRAEAAVKIQAIGRGFRDRRRCDLLKHTNCQHAAAIKIQTRARGVRDRNRVRSIREQRNSATSPGQKVVSAVRLHADDSEAQVECGNVFAFTSPETSSTSEPKVPEPTANSPARKPRRKKYVRDSGAQTDAATARVVEVSPKAEQLLGEMSDEQQRVREEHVARLERLQADHLAAHDPLQQPPQPTMRHGRDNPSFAATWASASLERSDNDDDASSLAHAVFTPPSWSPPLQRHVGPVPYLSAKPSVRRGRYPWHYAPHHLHTDKACELCRERQEQHAAPPPGGAQAWDRMGRPVRRSVHTSPPLAPHAAGHDGGPQLPQPLPSLSPPSLSPPRQRLPGLAETLPQVHRRKSKKCDRDKTAVGVGGVVRAKNREELEHAAARRCTCPSDPVQKARMHQLLKNKKDQQCEAAKHFTPAVQAYANVIPCPRHYPWHFEQHMRQRHEETAHMVGVQPAAASWSVLDRLRSSVLPNS